MRLEATIPDIRGSAVLQLADELGVSRSQVVDEAIALFLKVVLEIKRGRRLFALDPESTVPACEISTPTLAAFEWARKPEKLEFPAKALAKMNELVAAAASPGPRLRAAAQRSKK